MHFDLIVIGMGLSGLMAAKTAAEAGQKVLIIGKGMGGLVLFSNSIDVLGFPPMGGPEAMPLRENLMQWILDYPDHPYGKMGLERIEEALSSFNSLFPPPYTFQAKNGTNSLIPTGAGTFRPTYLIPSTMMRGIALRKKKSLIIGFKGYKDFYAQQLANSFKCRAVTLPLSEQPTLEITATHLARWMEQPSFREQIAKEVKEKIQDEESIGFPAVLGIKDPMGVRKDLEKRIGLSVFEIPVLPPSIPGIRIFHRFKERLIQRGVTFLLGHSVSKAYLKEKRCERIEVFNPPLLTFYTADRYILATGRFMGGGLKADREKISESIFNLPVTPYEGREKWFGNSFFDEHLIHRVGIPTDSFFRPMDESGKPILKNVWVAGTILAHHNFIKEKSREGIEIATGYWAAKNAIGR